MSYPFEKAKFGRANISHSISDEVVINLKLGCIELEKSSSVPRGLLVFYGCIEKRIRGLGEGG